MKQFYFTRVTRFIILYTLFFAVCGHTTAQTWTQTKGPGGGQVADMVEKNGVIIAATLNGLYRSVDNGDTWSRTMSGINDAANFHAVTATTNYLWAANLYGFEDLYRSADNGLTWDLVPTNLGSFFISKLYGSHDTLYLGCDGCGVARSVNQGASFEIINSGFGGNAFVYSFEQIGQNLFAGLRGNGGTVGIFRTNVTAFPFWQQMTTGSVIDMSAKGNDLLMTGKQNDIAALYRSSDLGNTWAIVPTGINAGAIATFLGVSGNNIFVGTDDGSPYRSADNGASFQRVDNNLKRLSVLSIMPGSNGVFIGHERGIARTTDNGSTWQRKVKGLTVSSITSLYATDNVTLYATGRSQNIGANDGVFSTTDGGQNWTSLDLGLLPNPEVNQLVKSGNNLIIGTNNYGLFIKTPSDAGFRRANGAGIPSIDAVTSLLSYGNVVLAGIDGSEELFRSTDNGLTWVQSNNGFRNDLTDQISCLFEKNGVMFAGGFDALYKSTDQGATWTLSKNGIYPGAVIMSMTGFGGALYAATDYNGIYKSTNNGAFWTELTAVPLMNHFKDITVANGVLYVVGDQGVYKSADGGASWTPMNGGLQYHNESLSIAVFNNNLVLGTDQTAVWNMSLGTVVAASFPSFSAKAVNGVSKLHWRSADETNVIRFDAERSTDGNLFAKIGSLTAAGTVAGRDYDLADARPLKGRNYYRIAALHANGNKTYSNVETVDFGKADQLSLHVLNNPMHLTSAMQLTGNLFGKVSIAVFDLSGRKVADVFSAPVQTRSLMLQLDRGQMKAGTYVIKVQVNNEQVTEKLVID